MKIFGFTTPSAALAPTLAGIRVAKPCERSKLVAAMIGMTDHILTFFPMQQKSKIRARDKKNWRDSYTAPEKLDLPTLLKSLTRLWNDLHHSCS
jgi:hypothetical protein